jgi:hypothetical protein
MDLTMKLTEDQKNLIYKQYLDWCDQVADDIDSKTWYTAEELVYKVLELVEDIE